MTDEKISKADYAIFEKVCKAFNELGAIERVTLHLLPQMTPVPKVGQFYHFFDEMDFSPERHYICRVTRIFTPFEAREILFPPKDVFVFHETFQKTGEALGGVELHTIWRDRVLEKPELFCDTTDYIIEAECPKYDNEKLYFARTTVQHDGQWVSMNVAHDWQTGLLDTTGEIYDSLLQLKSDEEVEKYKQKTF